MDGVAFWSLAFCDYMRKLSCFSSFLMIFLKQVDMGKSFPEADLKVWFFSEDRGYSQGLGTCGK